MSQTFDLENLVELCRRTHEETQRSEDFRDTVADFGYPTERVVTCRADFADTVCRIGEAVFPM